MEFLSEVGSIHFKQNINFLSINQQNYQVSVDNPIDRPIIFSSNEQLNNRYYLFGKPSKNKKFQSWDIVQTSGDPPPEVEKVVQPVNLVDRK